MLMKGNIAKVTDFGMARFLDLSAINPSDLTGCPGTKDYMPPEALADPPDYNHKIDVFSIGVLIIHILTGKLPNPSNQILCQDFSTRKCKSETERRADHIAECGENDPLKILALHCLQNNKDDRPAADQLCTAVLKIQQTPQYQEDRRIGDEGMQLAMEYNVPQVVNDQLQMITLQEQQIKQDEQSILGLNLQVREIQQAKDLGMQRILQL